MTPPPGCDLVLTTDGVIAGVHFFADDPPGNNRPQGAADESLRSRRQGREADRLSDVDRLAGGDRGGWIAAFAAGLGEDAAHYGCPLLGGDTDHTPGPMSVSITAFGAVPQRQDGAALDGKAGDGVVVTGTIGDAALGVMLRRDASLRPALAARRIG